MSPQTSARLEQCVHDLAHRAVPALGRGRVTATASRPRRRHWRPRSVGRPAAAPGGRRDRLRRRRPRPSRGPAARAGPSRGPRASRDREPGAARPPAAPWRGARSPRSAVRSARPPGCPRSAGARRPSPSWMSNRLSSTRSPAIGPIQMPLSVSTPSTSSASSRTRRGARRAQSPCTRARQRSSVRSSSSVEPVERPLGRGVARRPGRIGMRLEEEAVGAGHRGGGEQRRDVLPLARRSPRPRPAPAAAPSGSRRRSPARRWPSRRRAKFRMSTTRSP